MSVDSVTVLMVSVNSSFHKVLFRDYHSSRLWWWGGFCDWCIALAVWTDFMVVPWASLVRWTGEGRGAVCLEAVIGLFASVATLNTGHCQWFVICWPPQLQNFGGCSNVFTHKFVACCLLLHLTHLASWLQWADECPNPCHLKHCVGPVILYDTTLIAM